MNRLPYNVEISHCPGAGARLCGRCYRNLLFRKWKRMSRYEREAILLLPASMRGPGCTTFYDVARIDKGFYRRNDRGGV